MANLPNVFKINSVTPVDNYAYQFSETRSLKSSFRALGGQRFEFQINSVELEKFQIKQVMAFTAKVNRTNDSINLVMPIFSESNATTTTTIDALVKGDAQVELSSISGVEVGDFFNIAGHSKSYIVDGVVGSDITFSPPLLTDSVASGAVVTFNGCVFKMKLRNRVQSFSVDADRNSASLQLDLIEDL